MRARPLDDATWLVIFVDGFDFAGQTMVGALGVTADGPKVPLGVVEGSTENANVVRGLIAGLRDRGVDASDGILVVLHGGKALRAAVSPPTPPKGTSGEPSRRLSKLNSDGSTQASDTVANCPHASPRQRKDCADVAPRDAAMSGDDGLGAAGAIVGIGVIVWLSYIAALAFLFALVAGAAAIVAGVAAVVWYAAKAEKPGPLGFLVFFAGAIPLLALPFVVVYYGVLGGQSSSSDASGSQNLLSVVCFFWLIADLGLTAKLHEACLDI